MLYEIDSTKKNPEQSEDWAVWLGQWKEKEMPLLGRNQKGNYFFLFLLSLQFVYVAPFV